MTHTLATLEISTPAHAEIKAKLKAAGYEHALLDYDRMLDMTGMALVPTPSTTAAPAVLDELAAAARQAYFTSGRHGHASFGSLVEEAKQSWRRVATAVVAAQSAGGGGTPAAKPLDDPRLQQLFGDCIEGALTFGFQGNNPPPAGHWLTRFWNLGRAEAAKAPAAVPLAVLQALRFYARGEHLNIDEDHQEFDTVSGEPQNWLCSCKDDDATMFEDGSVARMALLGGNLTWEEDEEPAPLESEVFGVAPQKAANVIDNAACASNPADMPRGSIHVVRACNEYEKDAPIRAFEDRSDAERFKAECEAYAQTKPEAPEIENTPENDAAHEAWWTAHQEWIAKHPASDSGWYCCDCFDILDLPFAAKAKGGAA